MVARPWRVLAGWRQTAASRRSRRSLNCCLPFPVEIATADTVRREPAPRGFKAFVQSQLFRPTLIRRTIFSAVPWFLMDIATYGVGIFTPTLLSAIVAIRRSGPTTGFDEGHRARQLSHPRVRYRNRLGRIVSGGSRFRSPFQHGGARAGDPRACRRSAWRRQCSPRHGHCRLALFNTFMNAGPNATTYAIPAEVFPSEVRAAGHGFAAGCGKLGAALGVFLFRSSRPQIGLAPWGVAGSQAPDGPTAAAGGCDRVAIGPDPLRTRGSCGVGNAPTVREGR